MSIHPGMVEDRAAGTLDLYAQAEERLLGIIARQLADGLDAPGRAEHELAVIQLLWGTFRAGFTPMMFTLCSDVTMREG